MTLCDEYKYSYVSAITSVGRWNPNVPARSAAEGDKTKNPDLTYGLKGFNDQYLVGF